MPFLHCHSMSFPPVPTHEVVQLSQCLHALISHLDGRRYGALADLFTPQGRWLRQGRWCEGREAILQALESRPQGMRVFHVLTNVLVTRCHGDEAQADAYMTAYRQLEGGQAELFSINTVATTFHREGGQWRIAEQQMVRQFEFTAG